MVPGTWYLPQHPCMSERLGGWGTPSAVRSRLGQVPHSHTSSTACPPHVQLAASVRHLHVHLMKSAMAVRAFPLRRSYMSVGVPYWDAQLQLDSIHRPRGWFTASESHPPQLLTPYLTVPVRTHVSQGYPRSRSAQQPPLPPCSRRPNRAQDDRSYWWRHAACSERGREWVHRSEAAQSSGAGGQDGHLDAHCNASYWCGSSSHR